MLDAPRRQGRGGSDQAEARPGAGACGDSNQGILLLSSDGDGGRVAAVVGTEVAGQVWRRAVELGRRKKAHRSLSGLRRPTRASDRLLIWFGHTGGGGALSRFGQAQAR